MDEQAYDFKEARRGFSKVGIAFSVLVVSAVLGSLLIALLPELIWGPGDPLTGTAWWKWVPAFVPMYLLAFPLCYLLLRRQPVHRPEKQHLPFGKFMIYLAICWFLMYAGNLVGTVMSFLLSGGKAENAVETLAMEQHWIKVLMMVVLAPVFEELICRKVLIDRVQHYGQWNSVLLSGLMFGLLHQNLFQFFYAFGVGCVFAVLYLRTGRIRYSIVLHMMINFNGGVIAPAVLKLLDVEKLTSLMTTADLGKLTEVLPGLLLYMVYSTVIMGLAVFGLVMLIIKRRKLVWKQTRDTLPPGTAIKTTWLNPGMMVYTLLCLSGIVMALL